MEDWKWIKEWKGLYKIYSDGRVYSIRKSIFLKPDKTNRGYYKVKLYKHGYYEKYKVARLVAKAFIPNSNNYSQVNHKDGIKVNDNIENLEWCNNSQNSRHAVRVGLWPVGERHCRHKLTERDVLEIRKLKGKELQRETAVRFGVSRTNVKDIQNYKTWKHLKGE